MTSCFSGASVSVADEDSAAPETTTGTSPTSGSESTSPGTSTGIESAGSSSGAGTGDDSTSGGEQPEPQCSPLSDAELRSHGYEPVRAHGARGDGISDDTDAIRAAIAAGADARRVVYFHAGTYLIRETLEVRMDALGERGNDDFGRYGNVLQGSYCGERPTLRMQDGVAPERPESAIAAAPVPLLLLMRNQVETGAATHPDNSFGGKDWNQVVRNLHLVLGDNPGAVGIRHQGAEGSSASEVSIDARGAFAGLYSANSSGGYTYDVEVVGGRYGLYLPSFRGGSPVIVGLRLRDQTAAPIAFNHYGPLTIVGFDIESDGPVVRSIVGGTVGPLTSTTRSGGHISMVDGTLRGTGSAVDAPAIANVDRSVYLENTFVRGYDVVVENGNAGNLEAASSNQWHLVRDYSVFPESASRVVAEQTTAATLLDGALHPPGQTLRFDRPQTPPDDLIARHLYPAALCNVEDMDMIFVSDFGADPGDDMPDTVAIQAAIDAARDSGLDKVFLSAATADEDGAIRGRYLIEGPVQLHENTRLCGASRYSSILDARTWSPEEDTPVLSTPDEATATTTVADFRIILAPETEDSPGEWAPSAYAIRWRAGNGLFRDVYYRWEWGTPGERRSVIVEGNGGGRWFAPTQHVGYTPENLPGGGAGYLNDEGALRMSPLNAHMYIDGTHNPLTFYAYHSQHITPPAGATTWVVDSSNVRFFGMKSELGSIPERMAAVVDANPPELIPVWMKIIDSHDVVLIGHETLGQSAQGRGLIEVSSSDVRIVNFSRRTADSAEPLGTWFLVEEDDRIGITPQRPVSLFETDAEG